MLMEFDYLVIGAGPAGVLAATTLSKQSDNKRIAVVSKHIGGSYSSEGFILSNSLLYFSQLYDRYVQVSDNFILTDKNATTEHNKIDFKQVKKYLDANSNKVKKNIEDALDRDNITYIEGIAEFLSPSSIKITAPNNDIHELIFGKAIIAVGSYQEKFLQSQGSKSLELVSISSLTSLPQTVVIIGAGFIGIEIATFFSRLGSKVTIIEQNDRILSTIDHTIAKKIEEIFRKNDITILLGKKAEKIEKIGLKYLILFDDMKVEAEEMFVSTGRIPNIKGLQLEVADIKVKDGAPICDINLATSNKNVYVAGDISKIHMQTSWAFHSGVIAARNILGEDILYDENSYPTFISSDPEVGYIGLSEEEAERAGYSYGVVKINNNGIFNHLMSNDSFTMIKIIYNKADKSFLGVYILGSGVREILSAFNIFIQADIKVDEIASYIGIRPVYNEIFTEIVSKVK